MEHDRFEPPASRAMPHEPDGSPPLASEGRRAAEAVAGRVKERVALTVEQRKEDASGGLDQIARALHDVSRSLEGNGLSAVSGLGDRAATQVERTADYLRRRDFDGLLRDTRQLARRHPEVFLGGALLAGILLGRFLRSSTPEPDGETLGSSFDDELGLHGSSEGQYSEPSPPGVPTRGWA